MTVVSVTTPVASKVDADNLTVDLTDHVTQGFSTSPTPSRDARMPLNTLIARSRSPPKEKCRHHWQHKAFN